MAPATRTGGIARLAPGLLAVIEQAARAALPAEACGLLIGRATGDCYTITKAVESPNLAAPARPDRFEIDPRLQLHYQKTLRGSGEAVIGHYHSHPRGEAAPSATDIAEAHDPTLLWLITAVTEDGQTQTAAYTIERPANRVTRLSLQAP